MKKIILTLFLAISGLALSQNTINSKKLALIDGMIASQSFVNKNKQNIKSTTIIATEKQLPANLKGFNLPLTSVVVKENYYDKIKVSEINKQFDLPENNPIYFDGNLIQDANIKVISNAIGEMTATTIEGKKVVNIISTL